jgi:hypothetical protein
METSMVRRGVLETIERARRSAAERRARSDEAAQAYAEFLNQIAIPLVRQLAGSLKASGYPFGVFTPGGSVRLMSERTAEDYIELSLDTSGDTPIVLGHVSRARGRRIVETERPIASEPIAGLTEQQVLDFFLRELEPFVER